MIIDTHTHILDTRFDADRMVVIARAASESITMIESALDEREWLLAKKLAEQFNNIHFTAGFHPHAASQVTDEMFSNLENFCNTSRAVGIGEAGLDYHYDRSTVEEQKKIFIKHIELAHKLKKPLIVHCRDAYKDCINILKSISNSTSTSANFNGVIHCFSGGLSDAEEFIKLGFLIGIDGPLTYPNAANLREVVQELPLEKILVETDSPYLPPQKHRGERNEPVYIKYIIAKIAEIKGLSFETVSSATADNAKELFGINKRRVARE